MNEMTGVYDSGGYKWGGGRVDSILGSQWESENELAGRVQSV